MLHVALTGSIASGKSQATQYFKELGAAVVDTDIIARKLTEPHTDITEQIINKFGASICSKPHEINRRALRNIIFEHEQSRIWLEELLHPLIRHELKQQLLHLDTPYCIIVIPLLKHKKQFDFIDRIIVIDCDIETQKKRLAQRDHYTKDIAEKVINIQISQAARNKLADDIINNDGDLVSLQKAVIKLDALYKKNYFN